MNPPRTTADATKQDDNAQNPGARGRTDPHHWLRFHMNPAGVHKDVIDLAGGFAVIFAAPFGAIGWCLGYLVLITVGLPIMFFRRWLGLHRIIRDNPDKFARDDQS